MSKLDWMAWTIPTACFFSFIVLMLIGMTIWEIKSPTIKRKGFLPISTTRGDRLFIGLLTTAYIHLAWIGLTELTVWFALGISLVWMAVVMRWG
ncbi:MAG: DUF2160 domain-containing protein [Desulfobacterales bacterium]|nr:DUF2160 domain-containing protein [Desulfobacterales bacterium]